MVKSKKNLKKKQNKKVKKEDCVLVKGSPPVAV